MFCLFQEEIKNALERVCSFLPSTVKDKVSVVDQQQWYWLDNDTTEGVGAVGNISSFQGVGYFKDLKAGYYH